MSIDERLRTALLIFALPVIPNVYKGEELKYIVYNYSTIPGLWAEDRPHVARYLIQVHLYIPHGEDSTALRLNLARAIHKAGCTYPSIEPAHDDEGQHWVFECEAMDGEV